MRQCLMFLFLFLDFIMDPIRAQEEAQVWPATMSETDATPVPTASYNYG